MCLRPLTLDTGDQVSCRVCDACIAQRRFDWVSRGMAEKAVSAQTLVITLTYDEKTQENRDGARMFRYADVRRFFARLRRAIFYKYSENGSLRFLVAGEQGDQFQRVHWHAVLFSDFDLLSIGEWSNRRGEILTDPEHIVSGVGLADKAKRVHWDQWPHGIVCVQVPDESGLHYALSYALKDAFAVDKARADKRISKAENYATGVFRMSKRPPIGGRYIDLVLAELASTLEVLPSPRLTVPDLRGYWYPRGVLREKLLDGLRGIKDQSVSTLGRVPPQWSSLLASCADNPTDLERLLDGEVDDEEEPSIERSLEFSASEQRQERVDRQIARKCGGAIPCAECLATLDAACLDWLGLRFGQAGESFVVQADGSPPDFEKRGGGINSFCAVRDSKSRKRVFPQSANSEAAFDARKGSPGADGDARM